MVEPYPITGAKKMLEVDAEKFGTEVGRVMREALAPLKQQIEEQKREIEQLQKRVSELENLTEGLK